MNPIIREAIVSGQSNVIISLSAADLREIVSEMAAMERQRIDKEIELAKQRPSLTIKEACKMIGVSKSTLYQWEKSGYLVPIKVGRKVLYRAADIEMILTAKQRV